MQLINTNGMAFIGPGSEWLWAMLTGVAIPISFIAVYRQLRLQNAANVVQRLDSLSGLWDSERMIHARLVVAMWLKHASAAPPTYEAQAALGWACGFFEDLADLEEEGHVT